MSSQSAEQNDLHVGRDSLSAAWSTSVNTTLITFSARRRVISARGIHAVLFAAIFSTMLFDAAPARAAMLRCASHQLAPAERQGVFERARRALPRDGGTLTLHSACSNEDFAIAWFQTATVTDPDGLLGWWSVRCDRKRRAWSCAPAERQRRIRVSLENNGHRATVVGAVPQPLSATRAQAIVTRTATLAMKADLPLAACAEYGDEATRWRASLLDPPDPDLDEPAADVQLTKTGPVVDYGNSLRFRFDHDDQPLCWEELIIVD